MRTYDILTKIHAQLVTKGWTLSAAESLTCGLVQDAFGQINGISAVFMGGITAYSLDAKVKLLGVEREFAAQCNCVAPTIARQMAEGVCEQFDTHVGVSTTGYAVPDPAQGISAPLAYISVVTPNRGIVKKVSAPENIDKANPRNAMRQHVTEQVLIMTLALLEKED